MNNTFKPIFKKKGLVYYPWRAVAVPVLPRKEYNKIRLARNQDLILPSEQKKFNNLRVGIAGLNVGNPAAICLALEADLKEMRLADNDVLDISNLNRFRAGLPELGLNKVVLTARQIYEINPYANVKVFLHGVEEGQEEKFLLNPKIDVLVEEMDNLPLKISIREKARQYRIPVVMVTGNGENVIIDVERFDVEPDLPLLNGYLKPSVIKKIKLLKKGEKPAPLLLRDFMGAVNLTPRLRQSFLRVGKILKGIPQIAESSFLRGAVVCYVVRQIACGFKVKSGRYNLRLDNLIR
jgi:hypothetical protein